MGVTLSAVDIDAALIGYLPFLEKEQKAAVLGIIEALAPIPDAGGYWDDPAFVAGMERRLEDYRSGKVKAVSFEDVKASTAAVVDAVRKERAEK